jgi:dienelactone hydrolase
MRLHIDIEGTIMNALKTRFLQSLLLLSVLSLLPTWASATPTVTGKEVSYQAGDTTLKGYLATNNLIKGRRPGVLVVHEWWGHNDYARQRARMLAELGYTALAIDMYGNGKQADHPKDAGKFAGEVAENAPLAKARFLAAMRLLQSQPNVQDSKIAAIGYCFGGAVVLEMARSGIDLAGVASFHGSLGTKNPAQAGHIKAKILVMNGDADPFVKSAQISTFKQEMQNAGVDFEFISYAGAQHSFTNPDADDYGQRFKLPLAYNAQADQASWHKMQGFFQKIFR